jgi:hypothetical protein
MLQMEYLVMVAETEPMEETLQTASLEIVMDVSGHGVREQVFLVEQEGLEQEERLLGLMGQALMEAVAEKVVMEAMKAIITVNLANKVVA